MWWFGTRLAVLALILFGVTADAVAFDRSKFFQCSRADQKLRLSISDGALACLEKEENNVDQDEWDASFEAAINLVDCRKTLLRDHLDKGCKAKPHLEWALQRTDQNFQRAMSFLNKSCGASGGKNGECTNENLQKVLTMFVEDPTIYKLFQGLEIQLEVTFEREKKALEEYTDYVIRENKARAAATSRRRPLVTLESLSGGLLTTKPRQPQYIPAPSIPERETMDCYQQPGPYSRGTYDCYRR